MNTFRIQDPLWLLLILPAAISVWAAVHRSKEAAVLFSSLDGLRGLPVTAAQHVKKLLPFLRLLGVALLVFSLARPQQGREEKRIRTEGIAIMMVVDRSGSMRAVDFEIDGRPADRLEVVKAVFRDFVAGDGDLKGRPDDRIGLVAFGGFADSLCPLTLDHGALLEILDDVKIPEPTRDRRGNILDRDFFAEELATAIGDGLAIGVSRLSKMEAKSRVLVLLSDGSNNAGVVEPAKAAEAAKALGVKVYTIGIGSDDPVPVPEQDAFGRAVLVSQRFPLDEELLSDIAATTGGRYFNARDTDTLEEICATIDAMERTETDSFLYTEYRELFHWALLPGLALLLVDLVLRSTRFSSLP